MTVLLHVDVLMVYVKKVNYIYVLCLNYSVFRIT